MERNMGTLLYWIAGVGGVGAVLWGIQLGEATRSSLIGWTAFMSGAAGAALFAGVGYAIKLLEAMRDGASQQVVPAPQPPQPRPEKKEPKTYVID
jgi:hypothetical protein